MKNRISIDDDDGEIWDEIERESWQTEEELQEHMELFEEAWATCPDGLKRILAVRTEKFIALSGGLPRWWMLYLTGIIFVHGKNSRWE